MPPAPPPPLRRPRNVLRRSVIYSGLEGAHLPPMVAPPKHRTAENLTDLPSDLLCNIYCALANPLAPAAACYFASTCHDVRSAALARAASATFSEAQHLQCFWARATALCKSKRMTRSLLSRATQFTAGPVISGECFSAADAEIFGNSLFHH